MASAEVRAGSSICFRQENFRMPHNFSDQPSKNLEPDFTYSDCDFVNSNSDMKWWLHVKTNLGDDDANYSCQNLNYLDSEFLGGNQCVKNFDPLSCVGIAATNTIGLEQPWNVPSKCLKKCNDTGMLKVETALNSEFHLAPMKKNKGEFWLPNDEFVESDVTSFLVYDYEQRKSMSSDLESHWIGAEKTRPWWRATERHDLASLLAQKSHEYIENCDLPEPHVKPFRKILPVLHAREIDHDKKSVSSLNQKSEMCSSDMNGCSSETLTSGCSFQDSERTFSSSQSSRESSDSSINKDNHINSASKDKAEILKALSHSQTRAREAEKAAQQAFNEKEHILSLFFKQASQLFAYKQWLHVLQLENLCLQLRSKNKNQVPLLNLFYKGKKHKKGSRKSKKRKDGIRKCVVAFAVGLALAGAGLLLGWNLGYMFPPF